MCIKHSYLTLSRDSTIVYKIDDSGLVESQIQEWSIPASTALRETFTPPALNAPFSDLPRSYDEPEDVGRLFDMVNGRRPDDYTQEQRFEVAALIEKIANAHYEWKREDLHGKWALAYLQAGPNGGGIDRRIPFPDLPFNNNYQIFSTDSVTNVGELAGPLLEVRVGGSLAEDDATSLSTPKRYRASIDRGSLCAGGGEGAWCVPRCRSPARAYLTAYTSAGG